MPLVAQVVRESQPAIHPAGRGSYGSVYQARVKDTDETVAIKVIPVGEHDDIGDIQKEIDMLKECDHPNVVRYLVPFPAPHLSMGNTLHTCHRLHDPSGVRQPGTACLQNIAFTGSSLAVLWQMRVAMEPQARCPGGSGGAQGAQGPVKLIRNLRGSRAAISPWGASGA